MASAEDLEIFPGATDVVRVGSPRWTAQHDDLSRALAEIASEQCRGARSVAQIVKKLSRSEPRIQIDEQWVYLLLAPGHVRLDDQQRPQLEVKGLVFEPLAKVSVSNQEKIVVDF